MKKIHFIIIVALAFSVLVSCTKEPRTQYITKTLDLGFENTPSSDPDETESPDTKNFLQNTSTGEVRWLSGKGVDYYIHAFDEDDVVHRFQGASTSPPAEQKRKYVCTTWPAGKEIKLVVWTGSSNNNDLLIDGLKITGASSLILRNDQAPNNTHSFAQTVNFVVMKSGDPCLRSVFGFLRFNVPKFPGGTTAAHKYIKLTANEDIAGPVRIDYSGTDPYAEIIPGSGTSKSITLTVRAKSGVYETGYIYMAMPPGTYTGVTLDITPFAVENGAVKGEEDHIHLTLNKDLVIKRGCWTKVATLPAS